MTAQGATPGPARWTPGNLKGCGEQTALRVQKPFLRQPGAGTGQRARVTQMAPDIPRPEEPGCGPHGGGLAQFPCRSPKSVSHEPIVTRPRPSPESPPCQGPCLQPVTVSSGRNKHRLATRTTGLYGLAVWRLEAQGQGVSRVGFS